MKFKPITQELLIIAIIFIISLLMAWIYTGNLTKPFDISLHDTYFVLDYGSIYIALVTTVIIVTFVYLLRAVYFKFSSNVVNIILIGCTLVFQLGLVKLYGFSSEIAITDSGWTVYPPLSQLPSKKAPSPSTSVNNISKTASKALMIAQIILVALCITTGFKWNQHKESRQQKRDTA